jgi:tRNA (mo5U34)-methyltransferase
MLDEAGVGDALRKLGLGAWYQPLVTLCRQRLADSAHGDLPEWKAVLGEIVACDTADRERLRELLLRLAPWRKGPFDVHGIHIDAEWRSDLKWARVREQLSPLTGRAVLDVGCGNGFYALAMREAGASLVLGIDPAVLFVVQFEAIRRLTGKVGAHVLPLRLEDLPSGGRAFDTAFSMGVLYHRRDPHEHLAALRDTLRRGGELVLETLVLPGDHAEVLVPERRYARMRNVWHLPTAAALTGWLRGAGFADIRLIDVTVTTRDEQRSTEWMPFESLEAALDPDNPTQTIEGLPAPRRAILLARA